MEGSLNPRLLNEWLGELLQERGADLYRSKGILCLDGNDQKTVFQGVHNMWQFGIAQGTQDLKQPGAKHLNQMVFIGKNLDKNELTAAFKACLIATKTSLQA